jgi:hypothetical protein
MELICGLQARQMFLESPGLVGNGRALEKAKNAPTSHPAGLESNLDWLRLVVRYPSA